MDEIYMDIPAVRAIAKSFQSISEILAMVAKALEGLAMILKTTAFIGLVGGYAVLHFIEVIKPQIEKLSQKCAEISRDVNDSVDAYEQGDIEGANLFAARRRMA